VSQETNWNWRVLVLAVIAVMLALAIALLSVLALSRRANGLQLVFAVVPGDPLPAATWCSHAGDYRFFYCEGIVANQKIFYTRDAQTGRVDTISYRVEGVSVGELVNAWGLPTTMARYGNIRRVYWGDKSALILSKRFSPHAPAWFISLGIEPAGQVWRGFSE
jgi:hypothetical protein